MTKTKGANDLKPRARRDATDQEIARQQAASMATKKRKKANATLKENNATIHRKKSFFSTLASKKVSGHSENNLIVSAIENGDEMPHVENENGKEIATENEDSMLDMETENETEKVVTFHNSNPSDSINVTDIIADLDIEDDEGDSDIEDEDADESSLHTHAMPQVNTMQHLMPYSALTHSSSSSQMQTKAPTHVWHNIPLPDRLPIPQPQALHTLPNVSVGGVCIGIPPTPNILGAYKSCPRKRQKAPQWTTMRSLHRKQWH